MENTLKHIAKVASALCDRTASLSNGLPIPISPTHVPPLQLPIPTEDSLVSDLVSVGASRRLSAQLSAAFAHRAKELAETHCRPIYERTCKQISQVPSPSSMPQLPPEIYGDVFRHLYLQKLSEWSQAIKASFRERAEDKANFAANTLPSKSSTVRSKGGAISSSKFNLDFTPKLEAYFENNQCPSRADKEFLAKKSCMTYRQIHVWFQNRRSRSRKPTIRVRSTCTSVLNPSEMGGRIRRTIGGNSSRPGIVRSSLSISRSSSATVVEDADAFQLQTPPYAFPAKYPPNISNGKGPFPCRFGDFSMFSEMCWDRRPASTLRTEKHTIDLNDLISAFEKLHISDATKRSFRRSGKRSLQNVREKSGSTCNLIAPFIVQPVQAPLVSLVCSFDSKHGVQQHNGSEQRQVLACKPKLVSTSRISSHLVHTPMDLHVAHALQHISSTDQLDEEAGMHENTLLWYTPAPSFDRHTRLPLETGPALADTEALDTPSSHPSPTATIDSLPSLVHSSSSSSSSTYSQSPTPSFVTLSDDGRTPLSDCSNLLACESSLKSPLPQSLSNELSPSLFAPNVSFDFTKGSVDQALGLDLPTYPSYSESFDLISQGLQSSPDFPPPSLTFDLPSFAT